jgi:hypothetical protein
MNDDARALAMVLLLGVPALLYILWIKKKGNGP